MSDPTVEYPELKAEQRTRITIRANLQHLTVVAVAVIGWFALDSGNVHLLLAIPYGLTVYGWAFIEEDRKITGIRRHLQKVGLYPWEATSPGRRMWTRSLRFNVQLHLFILPAWIALAAWAWLAWADAHIVFRAVGVVAAVDSLILLIAFAVNAVKRIDPHTPAAEREGTPAHA